MIMEAGPHGRGDIQGLTLVELVIVITVSGILLAITPTLLSHSVQILVFLPRAAAANQLAMEAMHQVIEGGFSTLPGATTLLGLRFAVRTFPTGRSAIAPAIWLAEDGRIGVLSADGRYLLIRFDDINGRLARSLPPTTSTCSALPGALTEELIPSETIGDARLTTTGPLFRYYNAGGNLVPPSCPPSSSIRRVEIAFVAQTGNGVFEEGHAREEMTSAVMIRIP